MTTLTLQPDETDGIDTFVNSYASEENTNFATNTRLRVGEDNADAAVARSLLKFDLSSIPSNAIVSSATLSLWVSQDKSSNARDFKVYRVTASWVESTVTWNNQPAYDATAVATTAFTATEAVDTQKDFSLDAAETQKLIDGTYTYYGWIIKADTESNDEYYFYSSSEGTKTTKRPQLVVVYTTGDANPIWW